MTSHHIRGKQLTLKGRGFHREQQEAENLGGHPESALHKIISICAPGEQQYEAGKGESQFKDMLCVALGHHNRHPELKSTGHRRLFVLRNTRGKHWFPTPQSSAPPCFQSVYV